MVTGTLELRDLRALTHYKLQLRMTTPSSPAAAARTPFRKYNLIVLHSLPAKLLFSIAVPTLQLPASHAEPGTDGRCACRHYHTHAA